MTDSIMQMGEESTVKGYIENYAIDELTFDTLHFHQVYTDRDDKKMVVNRDTILLRYFPEFKTAIERHELTEADYKKYRFNPKRLSYDLYGTTELWGLLLDINEISSAIEFDLKTINVLPVYVVDRIERALNLEKDNRNYNAEEVSAALVT